MGMPSYLADIEERLAEDLRRAEEDRRSWNAEGRPLVLQSNAPKAPPPTPRWRIKQMQDAAREEARRIRAAVGNALWFEVMKDVRPLRRGCR